MKLHFLSFSRKARPAYFRFPEMLVYSILVHDRRFGERSSLGSLVKDTGFKHDTVRAALYNLGRNECRLIEIDGKVIGPVEPPAGLVHPAKSKKPNPEWFELLAFNRCEIGKTNSAHFDVIVGFRRSVKGKGRWSNRQVALELGLSEATVRRCKTLTAPAYLGVIEKEPDAGIIDKPMEVKPNETNEPETRPLAFEEWVERYWTNKNTDPAVQRECYDTRLARGWIPRVPVAGCDNGLRHGVSSMSA